MYSVSGATEDARSLSRNALACCVRGTRVSAWMTRNASNRAGGKSNPRFASGGNSCARRKPLSKSRRKRSIEAFAGSTICNSSNDERTRSSAGTKCISSNTSRDTATPSSSIESVCMYSFTNQGSGWNKRARMGGDEFALDSSAGRSISITIPPNSFPVPVKNRSTYSRGRAMVDSESVGVERRRRTTNRKSRYHHHRARERTSHRRRRRRHSPLAGSFR